MARSLTPEIDRVLLDTHTTATFPEAVRELRRVKSVLRAVDAYDRRPAGNEDEDALRHAAMVRALARLQRKEPKR